MDKNEAIIVDKNEEIISKKEILIGWLKIILIAMLISGALKIILQPIVVSGTSMAPTMHDGDRLLLNRFDIWFGNAERGDIAVFELKSLDTYLIKRVIAIPGDHIVIKDNAVTVNNYVINEPYIHGKETIGTLDFNLGEDEYFLMGDNRTNSMDSRDECVGVVKKKDILGTMLVGFLPFRKANSY